MTEKIKVLVVDDESGAVLKRDIENKDEMISCRAVGTIPEALELLEEQSFEVALVDLKSSSR